MQLSGAEVELLIDTAKQAKHEKDMSSLVEKS